MVICLTKHLLSDKHHFSRIWLAAHWERKIKKTQIFEVDIEKSIQDIMEAEIILDLRISGHLLVGIVKIHSRKTKYLLHECSSIFYQVKIFRGGIVDLPQNKQMASINDITLDGIFDNIENMAIFQSDIMDAILTNQSPIEEITLKETNERLLPLDDIDMTEFSFHEEDEPFDNFCENLTLLSQNLENQNTLNDASKQNKMSVTKKVKKAKYLNTPEEGKQDMLYDEDDFDNNTSNSKNVPEFEIPESTEISDSMNGDTNHSGGNSFGLSTHLNQETHKLNLEPLTFTENISKSRKLKKRKLSVDYKKCISYHVIKEQVLDTSDITCALELAPVSKRMMILKETGSANKLLCLPAIKLQSSKILKLTCQERNIKVFHMQNWK